MFDKYAAYRFEDFVQDERFIYWVHSPDMQSNRFWTDFLEAYPYQRPVIRRAKRVVQSLALAAEKAAPSSDAEEIWSDIQTSIQNVKKRREWWRNPLTIASAAASVAILVGFIYFFAGSGFRGTERSEFFFADEIVSDATPAELRDITNRSLNPREVILPDNSTVTLQPGSKLTYSPAQFMGTTRNVQLSGEAFFQVARDTERPFLVYSNGLITKVLGTSFTIKAQNGSDNVTVMVKSGKVSVFPPSTDKKEDPESKGLILQANQQAEYSKSVEKLTRNLVPEPVPVISEEEIKEFSFQNAPVADIFESLERTYNTRIIFDKEVLSECRLNSNMSGEINLFEKLDILCEAIDASYKVVDAQIVISGKKCQ